jgi:hypothetical protein
MARKENNPTSTHWISDLFRNKYVKVPAIIIIYALTALVVFIFCQAVFGYPIKVFGFELNMSEKKTDTGYVENKNNNKIDPEIVKKDNSKKRQLLQL